MTRSIESFYVFLVEDKDGVEGIAAMPVPAARRWEPMIATTQEKLEQLRVAAVDIVKRSGQRMRIAHFSCRSDVEDLSA